MKVKQLRTEYVQDQFEDVVGREKNTLLSAFVFLTVNIFLERDRAGSWWKPFIFLDEAGFTVTWS